MGEKALIQELAAALPTEGEDVKVGIGDDAAVLAVDGSKHLVISSDTLNEGIHFARDVDPESLGHKSLAVNLSDLAAMGATPRWALLNLTLREADRGWLDQFARGFSTLAASHGVRVVGGDTCRGPVSITVTILGESEPDGTMLRSGARVGDRIWLSGEVGNAGLGLERRQAGRSCAPELQRALDRPTPRVELGRGLRTMANACIDVSDGVLNDLEHLMTASGLGATLQLENLPTGHSMADLPEPHRWSLQLTAGEDYELCFTAPEDMTEAICTLGKKLGLPLSLVGHVHEGSGVECLTPDGARFESASHGWDHFSENSEGLSP